MCSVVCIDDVAIVPDAVTVKSSWRREVASFRHLVDSSVIVHVEGDPTLAASGIAVPSAVEGQPLVCSVADGACQVVAHGLSVVVCANDESSKPIAEVFGQGISGIVGRAGLRCHLNLGHTVDHSLPSA